MLSVKLRCRIPTLVELLEEEVELARNSSNPEIVELGNSINFKDETIDFARSFSETYKLVQKTYQLELENKDKGIGILNEKKFYEAYSGVIEAEKRLWGADAPEFKLRIIPAEKYQSTVKMKMREIEKVYGKKSGANTRAVLYLPHKKELYIPDRRIIQREDGKIFYKNWDRKWLKSIVTEEIDHMFFFQTRGEKGLPNDAESYNRLMYAAEALSQCNMLKLAKEDKELSDYVMQVRLNYWNNPTLNSTYLMFFAAHRKNPHVLALADKISSGKDEDCIVFEFDEKMPGYKERMKKFEAEINKFYPVSG
jgi:hypothetical protein